MVKGLAPTNEYLMQQMADVKLLQIGLPDEFIMQGTQAEMYAELGLDDAGIVSKVQQALAKLA